MPYQCAKAVCATFCHNIAGALIPIFGPDFPALCTPSEAPEYSRMIIDQNIVIQTTREAEHFRRMYSNALASSVASSSGGGSRGSPAQDRRHVFRGLFDDPRQAHPHPHPHPHQQHHHHHYRRPPIRRTFPTPTGCDTPYATDTDSDMSPVVAEQRGSIGHHEHLPYSPLPLPQPHPSLRPTSSGWTPANAVAPPPHHHPHHPHPHPHYEAPGPSPWLSAVPRFTTAAHIPPYQLQPRPPHQQQHPPQPWRGGSKRPAEHVDSDYEYADRRRAGSSSGGGGRSNTRETNRTIAPTPLTAIPIIREPKTGPREESPNHSYGKDRPPSTAAAEAAGVVETTTDPAAVPGADKNAALLLMNLSVRDARGRGGGTADGSGGGGGAVVSTSEARSPSDAVFPRIKRVRANST